jgi:undecaprenyl pyrophosphate phosphatase UppP
MEITPILPHYGKIFAKYRRIIGVFHGIPEFLCISSTFSHGTPTMLSGNLGGKHCSVLITYSYQMLAQ